MLKEKCYLFASHQNGRLSTREVPIMYKDVFAILGFDITVSFGTIVPTYCAGRSLCHNNASR
jgi:hypothetical protein